MLPILLVRAATMTKRMSDKVVLVHPHDRVEKHDDVCCQAILVGFYDSTGSPFRKNRGFKRTEGDDDA